MTDNVTLGKPLDWRTVIHSEKMDWMQIIPIRGGCSISVPSQWEMMLQCNIVSHWLGTFTKWSRSMVIVQWQGNNSVRNTSLLSAYILLYSDIIMSTMVSQITSITIVYSTGYLGADQRKHQRSKSLAFLRGIHWWPVNSPCKGPVTRKMFPFDDVIMSHFADTIIFGSIRLLQLKFTS